MIGMIGLFLENALMAGIYFLMALVAVRFFNRFFSSASVYAPDLLQNFWTESSRYLSRRAGIPGGNTDGNASDKNCAES